MKRTVFFALLLFLLFYGAAQAQTQTPSTTTPTPPLPLTPGQIATGPLRGYERVVYQFEVAAHSDMVLHYSADNIVMINYCTQVFAQQSDCEGGGGGDMPDLPVSATLDIPASNTVQTMLFTISRPLPMLTHYRVEITPVVPEALKLDESRTVNVDNPGAAYATYLLNVDPTQPFVIQIEDVAATGDFLWVANEPFVNDDFMTIDSETATETASSAINPGKNAGLPVDFASRVDNPDGVTRLQLDYLGGHEFRLFVIAYGTYLLHSSTLEVKPLEQWQHLAMTLSYRNPVGVARLNTTSDELAKVDVQVAQGKGVQAGVFNEGSLDQGYFSLGVNHENPAIPFPLAWSVQVRAEGEHPLYVVVHVANGSPREPIPVTMQWQTGTE